MSTWLNVVRYHLVDRLIYLAMPWVVLAFAFVVTIALLAPRPSHGADAHPGSVGAIFLLFFALGVWSMSRSLPFALALGVSRRSFYTATVALAVALAAVDAVGLAALQAVERATGGYGLGIQFFRVSYLLQGPWYLTWLTSFVGLVLLFMYGMWYGLVFRRWSMVGTTVFIAAQIAALSTWVIGTTWAHAWAGVARFFAALTPAGLTAVLAGIAAILLAGGYATIRRVTV